MRVPLWIGIGFALLIILVVLGVMVYALPAIASLPRGIRPGIDKLTIEDAAIHLAQSGAEGYELIEEARLLTGDRIEYCRRNSFNSYRKAFLRGYGYCQQEAYALAMLLQELGFNAWPVHSEHCDFMDKKDTGHAWLQVFYQGKIFDIDSKYMDPLTGDLSFKNNTPAKKFTPLFRLFSGWGSAAANARRYYKTGSDKSAAY